MGMYAESNWTIECENEQIAEAALQKINAMKTDENGNDFASKKAKRFGANIEGHTSSGKFANCRWQCQKIWDEIKNIPGVLTGNFPYMVESGEDDYFENES